jgi:hypothetical protein
MADVFLSYARADRLKAEQVKAALEGAGLSVFFDVEGLDGGDLFPDVLDREVKTAGAEASSAGIGRRRNCLTVIHGRHPGGDRGFPEMGDAVGPPGGNFGLDFGCWSWGRLRFREAENARDGGGVLAGRGGV